MLRVWRPIYRAPSSRNFSNGRNRWQIWWEPSGVEGARREVCSGLSSPGALEAEAWNMSREGISSPRVNAVGSMLKTKAVPGYGQKVQDWGSVGAGLTRRLIRYLDSVGAVNDTGCHSLPHLFPHPRHPIIHQVLTFYSFTCLWAISLHTYCSYCWSDPLCHPGTP